VSDDDLASAELPDARVVYLVGKPGSGKTATSRARVALFPRVLVVDTLARNGEGQYHHLVISDPDELAEFLEERGGEPRWRVSYRGPVFFPVDPAKPHGAKSCEAFFNALADIPNFLLVVEEAETYMTADAAPKGIFDIVRKGRTSGQAITLCAHRFTDLARDLTAVADLGICWRLKEPGDRKSAILRGFPEDVMETLKGYESIRCLQVEGELERYYVCRCDAPHSGTCGEPIPMAPVKVSTGKEA
jgi:hypothetical protein